MNMERLKKFIMNNYKMLIPIMLLVVVFLAFIIYYFVSRTFTFSEVKVSSYYQYFSDTKSVYDVEITKNRKGVITNIEPVDRYVGYDSTPLYDTNGDVVIFPSDMSIITPIVNCAEYLVKANAYVKYENKRYSLITENYNQYLSHYFFFDGFDLYFFIEDVTLVMGDNEVELSPFSYVVAGDKNITYYDKVNDNITSIKNGIDDIYIENEYYKVYINADYVDYYGERVILTQDIDFLSTIDQMSRITND